MKINQLWDKRCYNCGDTGLHGVIFGKYQRLICKDCLPKVILLSQENTNCIDCGQPKNCRIVGLENSDVKKVPIAICKECLETALKLIVKE